MDSPHPPLSPGDGRWRFAIDRGGTFTDVVARAPDGALHTAKLLSLSPAYPDAALEGMRRFLEVPPDTVLPQERVAWIRLGTTVATNALLERTGEPTGLLITAGFRDLLEIGDQTRPDLFALAIRKPGLLYAAVEEIPERIGPDGRVERPIDSDALRGALERMNDAGVRSLAVVFLHAWKNPCHERRVLEAAQAMGCFAHISVSHQAMALIQVVGRGRTTLVDAYLSPVLLRYARQVQRWTGAIPLRFMSSSGSLLPPAAFTGKDAILSGPAGGVLGVAAVARACGDAAVLGFDMGGTSTDVCRFDGALERVLETETAGVRYHAPMLRVETVAAGGGSLLRFDGRKLSVGPDSAGAIPGPACYGLGGPATLTDAQVVLGRIRPEFFPRLFGPDRASLLDVHAARARLQGLAQAVAVASGDALSVEALALGWVEIANETMARPVKALSAARGFDPREHALVSFGGAGGQHACGLARTLGLTRVRLHPLAGLLSALGIAWAAPRRSRVESFLHSASAVGVALAQARLEAMVEEASAALRADGEEGPVFASLEVDLRTPGTDTPLTLPFTPDPALLAHRFQEAHQRLYGFAAPEGAPELVTLRVEVRLGEEGALSPAPSPPAGGAPTVLGHFPVWFDPAGPTVTPFLARASLPAGQRLPGPAIVVEPHATTVVEPGFVAAMGSDGILSLYATEVSPRLLPEAGEQRDPIRLELFHHRFMGIAVAMGETLARTAHSVNIKERRDFSCAIFDPAGRLVANAPHVPVHLGAMGETVRHLLASRGSELRPGDQYATNAPALGGSHLPDVTVMAPLFREGRLAFLVASRGHHADIGGTAPGSMPPEARTLEEEGVALHHLLLVREGVFREQEVTQALIHAPWPARNLPERLSDLRAQMAANMRGLAELGQLCERHGEGVVAAYMGHMRQQVREAMEAALARLLGEREHWRGSFADTMDQGESIAVVIDIERTPAGGARARVDFTGSAPTHPGNLNAPPAVARAALLYVLRTLIREELPLNDGCLEPITLILPPDSLLNPAAGAAVAGGNVETSQRIVDVLYGALGLAAASQGTMNNLLFGPADGTGGQYYETIAGGAGAVAGADGASGVQVHMTNTRITDPEVLELRFPALRLEAFTLRRGSGGAGRWRGGEGVIRRLRFLAPMVVTLLTQRRLLAPFGLHGGGSGACGANLVQRAGEDGFAPLPESCRLLVEPGDRLEIRTPGGGGFGSPAEGL